MTTRREFLKGMGALGAFGASGAGRFLLAAGDLLNAAGKPRLKFGVVSDLHIVRSGLDEKLAAEGNALTFIRALEWFRSQNVDAVAITGDMADHGNDVNLMAVADAWYSVFPEDRYPDGRRVEKLFITGNHDWCGDVDAHNEKLWPAKDERAGHILQADMARWWEKAFHEAYLPVWRKDVNGFTFVGCHWDASGGAYPFARIKEWMDANARSLDPSQPFFYLQHPHLKDTCYGPWAWGRDKGIATKTLAAFPNAIALSGHSHYPLTDERSIWQGAFTSVGCASLRYANTNYSEFPDGLENWSGGGGREGWKLNGGKFLKKLYTGDARHGMLWSVYDDAIIVRKREFLSSSQLGADWVIPLPAAKEKPFAFAARAKALRAPQFAPDAALSIERIKAKNRGGRERNGPGVVKAVLQDAVRVTAPAVEKDELARAYCYEFTAVLAGGEKILKRVAPPSYHHSTANWRKMKEPASCIFGLAELGGGQIRFEAAAANSFGAKSRTLSAAFQI